MSELDSVAEDFPAALLARVRTSTAGKLGVGGHGHDATHLYVASHGFFLRLAVLQKLTVPEMSVAFVYFAAFAFLALDASCQGLLFRLMAVFTFPPPRAACGLRIGFMLLRLSACRSFSSSAQTSSQFSIAMCR